MSLVLHRSCYSLEFGTALDTTTSSKSIKDPEAITSSNGAFRLGFFSIVNSTSSCVGVWYSIGRPENSVIWVANRDKPLKDNSGVVMISEDGNLDLKGQKEILWSSNVKNRAANVSAQCERINSGNESGGEDGFLKLERTKVPDFAEWLATLEDKCKDQCLNNCSCIAYAYDPGIGCMS
ncbi:hypothetical protein POUND7_000861 [Theobroma cacao]